VVRVRLDHELEAIGVMVAADDDSEAVEAVVSPDSAVGLILGLTDCLGALIDGPREGELDGTGDA
jgi:hypothetical protein